MSAAFDYEDMHHLVDLLNPAQVRRLRVLVAQDEELSQVAEALSRPGRHGAPEDLLALIGSIDGPDDLGERHDYYISQRMQERFGGCSVARARSLPSVSSIESQRRANVTLGRLSPVSILLMHPLL